MSKECGELETELYSLRSKTKELKDAEENASSLCVLLRELEKVNPENAISAQLRPLYVQARDVVRGGKRSNNNRIISEAMKIVKPEIIAERIKASKPPLRTPITMQMVRFVSAMLRWCIVPVHELQGKLRYLRSFLKLTAEWCIEHESMKVLFAHAEDIAYTVQQLRFLAVAGNMDLKFSKVQKWLSPFRPTLRPIYASLFIASKSSSTSEPTLNPENMRYFVDALREDLEVAFDDPPQWFKDGLHTLFYFVFHTELRRIPLEGFNSLQSHCEALAIEAAIVIYSAYGKELEMKTADEINQIIFQLELKFNHVKVEIDLIKLHHQATIIPRLGNLIDYIREELIFSGTFLMNSLEQCKEQDKLTDFLSLIQSATEQAWSEIHRLSLCSEQEEYLAREVDCLHFQLLLKFNFVKAAIRQMCPDISATSKLDHPMKNMLNFLPINFEAIASYLSMLKSSNASSSDEVLMGFHEYILDNFLLKCENNMTHTVENEVKKFYHGLLLLITYFTEASEDAVNSNNSKEVNLVLQFLTETFKLVEYEERLMDLLKHNATLKAQILDLIEELIFFRSFLTDLLKRHTKQHLLLHAEVTVHKLAQIGGSFYKSFMDGSDTEKLRLSLSDSLQGANLMKVEVRKVCFQLLDASPSNMTDGEGLINFLLDHKDLLLNYDAYSSSYLKNPIPAIKDKLVHLGSFLADIAQYRDMHQELKDLWKRAQDMKYVCLFPFRDYRPVWYYMLYLSDVRPLLRFVEAEVKLICLKVPDSSGYSFPKTNGLGFLNCLLEKLEYLLHSKLDLVTDLKHQIKSAVEGLLCLRVIGRLAESYDEYDEVYGLIASGGEMVYKAEFVIDSCLAFSHPLWYKALWISEVVENIKLVNKVISETCERKRIDVTAPKVAKTSSNLSPSLLANTRRANEEMEGLQEAMDQIRNQLLGGLRQLDVISLVGMPGIGKTTLAEKIYIDLIVTGHFDVHAKCHVTQVYSWRDLVLTILDDVSEPVDRTGKGDGELADELRRFLSTKRFLIVIDDVWDKNVWDNLRMCLKDAQNGSRIILTTQLSDIASYAQCESKPHHLRLFRDDESWSLLQKQVFQGEICPCELVDVGFRIAKCCGGLPLFIVLVAGVLKEQKMKAEFWKKIEESLFSQNISCLEESMSVIGFSYKNLPHHLKPCFLYFGGLFDRKDINVSKLTQLWVAEGFVQANMEKGPEDVAQCFLGDLISRNLVMDVEKRPNGKVKICRIHDLLHTFCLEKAKQENFLLRINRFCGEDTFPEKPMGYRLFVHSYLDQIDLWHPSRSNVRSLLLNVIDRDNMLWPPDISFIFNSFKLIKVLDLESINIGVTFPSELQSLVQMKYFSVKTEANSIPSSIANLWNLETIVVRGLGGEVILPSSILKMVKLRHILVKDRASFSLHDNMDESLANSQLENLETFFTPRLSYGEDAETILQKMPNLRKLSCIFSESFGYSEKVKGRCVLYPRLEFLSYLESLKLVSKSYPTKLPHVFSFPSGLRELTLSKFRLPWTQVSTIGELSNLEILKLLARAFEGDEWEVEDSQFPKLRYLKLDNLNIKQWTVSEDAFPKLQRLVLTKCEQLEQISYFEELKSIEVNWCSWSVANSAQEIQTSQHDDFENRAFTVTIQPPDWARQSFP